MLASSWPLALVGAAALGGLLLLALGLRRRPRGSIPHCRRCDYNLTGLSGQHCPECGADLWRPRGIVQGARRRSPASIVFGLILLIPGMLVSLVHLSEFDWYPYNPTIVVIADLNSTAAPRAWSELKTRLKANKLSDAQKSRLADACLNQHGKPTPAAFANEMLDLLGERLLKNRLTAAQQQRFCQQMLTLELLVRPKVALGDSIPFRVLRHPRAPSGVCDRVSCRSIQIDDGRLHPNGTVHAFNTRNDGGMPMTFRADVHPGKHRLHAAIHVEIFVGTLPVKDMDGVPRLYGADVPLQAEFEVLPADAPGYIRHIVAPERKKELLRCIRPFQVVQSEWLPGVLNMFISASRPPVPVAFEVLVRTADGEHSLGTMACAAGIAGGNRTLSNEKLPPLSKCDVILRSSEKVARETLDLFEMWDGELIYKDVPVKQGQRAGG
jgi:hypothetical protein